MPNFLSRLRPSLVRLVSTLELTFFQLTQPSRHPPALSTVTDLTRTRAQLIAENALLRQQLIILRRQVRKPRFAQSDRLWLVLLASRVHHWKHALLILKPETLLRWHRQGFRLFWKFKSGNWGGRPRLSPDTINLIRQMARDNRLWGAERIRGELLKLHTGSPPRPSRNMCVPCIHTGLQVKLGRYFSTIMPKMCARAISCRSPISAFAKCISSS